MPSSRYYVYVLECMENGWMLDQYGIPKRLSGRQSPEKRKKENDELKTYSKELEEKIDKLKGK